MLEIVSSRNNPLVDPWLHVWGWEIPFYLFLGGWVAGMMVLSGYFLLKGRERQRRCVCFALPLFGLVLLSLGMLSLFLDLEHKPYVFRLYLTVEPLSPMSWGSWILVLVYPVLVANVLLQPPALAVAAWPRLGSLSRRFAARRGVVRAVGGASVLAGTALGIYTGILLSALGARPLWNSALLGPLFLVSGLSCGAAFSHMVARDVEERTALARADNLFLSVELGLFALYLIGLLSASEAHLEATRLLLGGPFTGVFWVFVVGLGVVIPLLIQVLAVSHRIAHTPVAPLLVLAGGLALRFVIVYAGQWSRWPQT